jgi:LmbE family N-acetylglucosaminyl deacetylase
VGKLLGIPVMSLNYPSEFYKLNPRDGSLQRFMRDIDKNLNLMADVIYTHNWWGEYGHLDHILVYYAMLQHRNRYTSYMTSDIQLQAGWIDYVESPKSGAPNGIKITEVENDLDLYNRCKAIYEKYNCWTWSQEPVLKANLILI